MNEFMKKLQADLDAKAAEPRPPLLYLKQGEHHWLEVLDSDGHSFGLRVLQWAPGAERWCHSGDLGTGMYVNTYYWKYHSPCPMPEFDALDPPLAFKKKKE